MLDTLMPEGSLHDTLLAYCERNKKNTSRIVKLEIKEDTAYVAVAADGMVQAHILPLVHLHPAQHGGGMVMVKRSEVCCETNNPTPCLVSADFLKKLSPPSPLLMTPEDTRWRERARAYAERVAQSEKGNVLLGRYTYADGGVSYNEVAKEEFKKDAMRFLKKLAATLGWPPIPGQKTKTGVYFNAGGIAVSGEAMLRLQVNSDISLMVEVSSDGFACYGENLLSESGTTIMWRFEKGQRGLQNHFVKWSVDVNTLAQMIHGHTIGRPELTPDFEKAA